MKATRHQGLSWCRRMVRSSVLGGLFLFVIASLAAASKPKQDRYVYCTRSEKDTWKVQTYPPLIDVHQGLVIEQIGYDGSRLDQVLLKSYGPAVQVTFDYTFDEAGRLSALHGTVRRWGGWLGEANLFPLAFGDKRPLRVTYYAGAGGTVINDPDDGQRYEPLLKSVVVYRTVNEIPCAGMLKEAEKVNATQE